MTLMIKVCPCFKIVLWFIELVCGLQAVTNKQVLWIWYDPSPQRHVSNNWPWKPFIRRPVVFAWRWLCVYILRFQIFYLIYHVFVAWTYKYQCVYARVCAWHVPSKCHYASTRLHVITSQKTTFFAVLLLLLLLLSSSSSSSSSSSVSPLCRVSTLIFLRQTMSLGNSVATILMLISWYVAHVFSKLL